MPFLVDTNWAICGEHEANAAVESRQKIILAPHPHAYGFGDQLETREHLDAIVKNVLLGNRVADVGTGTGILAIASALLGANVVAFEENDDYRALAKRNFALNNVTIELRERWPDDWDGSQFDFVLANLGKSNSLHSEVGKMGGKVINRG